MLDSPEGVRAGQGRFEYPATSVPFSNCRTADLDLALFTAAGASPPHSALRAIPPPLVVQRPRVPVLNVAQRDNARGR